MTEHVAVAGTGAIATGLAATVAAHHGDVLVVARSEESAQRARGRTAKLLEKMGEAKGEVTCAVGVDAARDATVVVEAIAEDHGAKCDFLKSLAGVMGHDAILATTTSSLSVEQLAEASGRPDRFAGLHVFNPVPRMQLIELVFPQAAQNGVRDRVRALCETLGKTAVEVPDTPGFVVNRLLFPYLFDAVRLMEQTGLEPEAIDTCMKLGAGHPMGPLALLDFVGLDVSTAIGEQVGTEIPARVRELIDEGALGRKSGRGFYSY